MIDDLKDDRRVINKIFHFLFFHYFFLFFFLKIEYNYEKIKVVIGTSFDCHSSDTHDFVYLIPL